MARSLPTGRTPRAFRAAVAAMRRLRPPRAAVACGGCESALLCPCDWTMAGVSHWHVAFRCGDCGAWTEILLSNAQVSRLDCELDHQLNSIRHTADGLERERMQAQVEAFVAGLRGGHVVPGDFAR